jgi:MoaA/NifB/PqqE/SkfB family radical SAM enzyme
MRSVEHDKQREINEILSLIDTTGLSPKMLARPKNVWFSISDICDLRCRFCTRQNVDDVQSGLMDFEKFRGVVEQLAGCSYGVLFGLGEPFLNKRYFDYLEVVHRRGLRAHSTSHGMLVDEALAGRVIESGLDELAVSMDGATAKTFNSLREPADFETVCRNVRRLADLKEERGSETPMILIPYTVSSGNVHEMVPMVELAHRLGANALGFADLVALNEDYVKDCVRDTEEFRRNLEAAYERAKELGIGIFRSEQKPEPWREVPAESQGRPNACGQAWDTIAVQGDGLTKVCCYLDDSGPNAFETPLDEAFNNEGRQQVRSDLIGGRLRPQCTGCSFLIPNSHERVEGILVEAERRIESLGEDEPERDRLWGHVSVYRKKALEVLGPIPSPPKNGLVRRIARRTIPAPVRRSIRAALSRISL